MSSVKAISHIGKCTTMQNQLDNTTNNYNKLSVPLERAASNIMKCTSRRINRGSFGVLGLSLRADALLITAKNSGTHWVMYMLSHALAEHYGKPRPIQSSGRQSRDFILSKNHPQCFPDIPKIYQSHTIPSDLLGYWPVQLLFPLPNTIVLVRDIRDALLSHYVKWQEKYGVSLSDYLRGIPGRHGYNADLWWFILFFNHWGSLAARYPKRVVVIQYEDLIRAPIDVLRRITEHWRLHLSEAAFAAAESVSSRQAIASALDPKYPEAIVSDNKARASIQFSDSDHAFIDQACATFLKHNLGYGFPTSHRK